MRKVRLPNGITAVRIAAKARALEQIRGETRESILSNRGICCVGRETRTAHAVTAGWPSEEERESGIERTCSRSCARQRRLFVDGYYEQRGIVVPMSAAEAARGG